MIFYGVAVAFFTFTSGHCWESLAGHEAGIRLFNISKRDSDCGCRIQDDDTYSWLDRTSKHTLQWAVVREKTDLNI